MLWTKFKLHLNCSVKPGNWQIPNDTITAQNGGTKATCYEAAQKWSLLKLFSSLNCARKTVKLWPSLTSGRGWCRLVWSDLSNVCDLSDVSDHVLHTQKHILHTSPYWIYTDETASYKWHVMQLLWFDARFGHKFSANHIVHIALSMKIACKNLSTCYSMSQLVFEQMILGPKVLPELNYCTSNV